MYLSSLLPIIVARSPLLTTSQLFQTEINSPLKPPTLNKDGGVNPTGVNGRKASLSQGTGNAFGVSSPSSATRPSTRRRETLESNPFSAGLSSPTTANRPGRDEGAWPPRKSSELKESEVEEPDADAASRDVSNRHPFGTLMRSNTAGSTNIAGSIWTQSNPSTPGGGAFGNFALGGSAIGTKPVGGGVGGSRLAHLMPKESSENVAARQGESPNPLNQQSWRSRQRTDTDPFGEELLSGSAVLGGAQDTTAIPPQAGRVGTLGTPVKGSTGDFGMSGLNLGGNGHDEGGPVSPSETNPYRSPPAERHDQDGSESGGARSGFPHEQPAMFNPLQQRPFGVETQDRSQTSSAKGFPIGHISAWGAPGGPTSGTPDRERGNFGAGAFSPYDIQSPSLGNLSSVFGPASAGGMGSIGRNSKLGSLFPANMQAQMQSHDNDGLMDSTADLRQGNPLGAIGRGNFLRETESPIRSSRGVFEELFPSSEASRSQGLYGTAEPSQAASSSTAPQSFTPVSGGMGFPAALQSDAASAQARTMVMPDRMRWVYLDPQGSIQGPFTGLEMNDWYKAQFFTPDLRVRKVEDPEFEPLGQLIRRIGNSREPFLVPQVGIPHGPPSQAGVFPGNAPGGIVPPLSGVFPSFGRTLTAEEQNNLERRKQEEQYLMAQQRDFVMRQQAMSRFQGPQQGLQHHSSAHSLQSQPSFGSIQSPIGMSGQGQQPPIGAIASGAAFFDPTLDLSGPPGGSGNEGPSGQDEFAHLTDTERQIIAALHAAQPHGVPDVEGSLRSGLPLTDQLGEDPEGFRERLMQFEDLRAEMNEELEKAGMEQLLEQEEGNELAKEEQIAQAPEPAAPSRKGKGKKRTLLLDDPALSLTQQVQQTQAAVAAAHEPGMPMPFPPPTSTTPLPAPTAQRVRSNLPEQYSRSQSGSPTDDTSSAPPPLAPWAKEPGNDAHKGPSLKEIQEAEARKAAKAEEAAAALRRAALEQEAALLREKEKHVAATTVGLPASSTWGHASPVASASPWSKPGPVKIAAPGLSTPSASSKKTLAEIQAEEERRKRRARDVAVQSGAPVPSSKSYANLAGKPGQIPMSNSPTPVAPPPGAGWAVVGASGKPKVPPTGPAMQSRSVSTSVSATISASVGATTVKAPTPTAIVKPVSRPGPAAANGHAGNIAMDEFRKWVNRELARGINVNDSKLNRKSYLERGQILIIDSVSAFAQSLENFPLDSDIIADAVYANSTIMDGRHFAEEYVRRKKLAEKGVVEKQPATKGDVAASSSSGGGWSEVAKKSSASAPAPREEGTVQPAGFKVVPGRKKGKK